MSEQRSPLKLALMKIGTSGMAAVMTVCIIHPIDVVKTRLQIAGEAGRQTKAYNGVIGTVTQIGKTEGYSAFYKGISAAMMREASYTSLRLGLYEPVKDVLGVKKDSPFYLKFLSASISGGIGSLAGNPFDVLKTRMMASEGMEKKSIGFHFKDIVKNQGYKGLYRGFSVNFSRACVLNGTKLGCYDQIKHMIMNTGMKDGIPLQFMSAFCAGFLMACTVNPFDMVRTRVMNQPVDKKVYNGMFDAFGKIMKSEGPGAFYKGFIPVWGRFAPTTVLQLLIWERLRKVFGLEGI